MIAALTNHLWQSTLFVAAAALVAFALRKNGAHIRHRVWLVASLKFLVPFSVLMSLGGALPSFTPAATVGATTAPALSVTVDRLAQPFTDDVFFASTSATAQPPTNWTAIVIVTTWACGFLGVAFMRLRAWRQIHAAVQASAPLRVVAAGLPPSQGLGGPYGGLKPAAYECLQVRSAPGLLEPGVVGLWRPVLLLPAGIERHLTPSQLEAVLAHELCHVERRDNLTSAIHMVVEAAFWFHPLVWFVGAKLVEERERACDEHVLRVVGEPRVYAESILNVCKLYVESPIACVSGVSGLASPKLFFRGGGADLKKRIAAILINRVGRQLSLVRKVGLATAAMLAIALPLVAGMLTVPASAARAASSGQAAGATSAGAGALKFDIASVKPCEPAPAPEPGQRGPGGQAASSGYLHLPCMTLTAFVSIASGNIDDFLSIYLRNRPDGRFKGVRGGPAWAATDRFTIEARAQGTPDRKTMQGPMLRALIEDRFQLKMHKATEDQAIYVMTVAAGGLKIAPVAPGSCLEFDPEKLFAGQSIGNGPICGRLISRAPFKSAAAKIGKINPVAGTALSNFLSMLMDRPVLDQTGLDGNYDVAFDYTPDDTTPNWQSSLARAGLEPAQPQPSSGPNIFKALEQLGLKLEPKKWPVEYIVIDHAERPKPDDPSAIVERPLLATPSSDPRRGDIQ